MKRCVTLAALLLGASGALAQPIRAPRVAIEDPSGHALDAFRAALERGRARVTVWGASHVASDEFTGFLRHDWQRRFGNGGPGWVMPAMPFSLYAHQDVLVAPSGAWTATRVRGQHRTPDAYGPFGIALDATRAARAWAVLSRGSVSTVAIYFWRRPDGGSIEVIAANERERISTRGPQGGAVHVVRRQRGIRRIDVRALGDGPVRLFGVSMERPTGVVIDALGIPGARLRDRLPWQDAPLREQMTALAPDLIVLSYGTNEAGMNGPIARHRAEADEAVRRARALVPHASCLLIGPSDWPRQSPDGRWVARPRTAEVANVMRESAARHGCGFFDLAAVSGGPGSMPSWVAAGLALSDHVHFTEEGHRIVARVLSRALLSRR